MSQLTCRIARICWFTVNIYMHLNWKTSSRCAKVWRRISKWLMIKKKLIISINNRNSWNNVGSLCTDDASSMLREVRFYNSGEQTRTAHHFYALCSSSTCTDELNPARNRILEIGFETWNWFLSGHEFVFSKCFNDQIDWSSRLSKALFQDIYILQPRFFYFWCWLGEKFSTLSKRAFEIIVPFRILICVRQGSP